MPSTLLASRFLLKRFSLQNLSFNSDYKTTLFCNTILFRKRLLKQGLTTYLTLVFFFFSVFYFRFKKCFYHKKTHFRKFFYHKKCKIS